MANIKIIVSCRADKESEIIDNGIFMPVVSGACFYKGECGALSCDDSGDNISNKNKSFCELTAMYWAWKNVDADYYGLFHYRRYFNFSNEKYTEDEYGNVIDGYINDKAQEKYGFTNENIQAAVNGYDIIMPEEKDISLFPEKPKTVRGHWRMASHLHEKDLQIMFDVLSELHPEYKKTAKKYLDGHKAFFCNMCIMRRQLFNSYCEWLFPILFEIEKRIDLTGYSVEGVRTIGHLAERLLGIYVNYQIADNKNLKIKYLQTVLFTNPEKTEKFLKSAFEGENNVVPVAFAANKAFAPACAVALKSLIMHCSENRLYDIVILQSDIPSVDMDLLKSITDPYKNISLRFFDARPLVADFSLTANAHITTETYYRFLIQAILPDYGKVLYLDGDIICLCDVAALYDTQIDGCHLAAVVDPDMNGNLNMPQSGMWNYVKDTLGLKDPYLYFQAGVLLLNTAVMRKAYTVQQWLTFASEKYIYSDQDVLNKYCCGHVKYLDMRWNVLTDCDYYRSQIIRQAEPAVSKEYFAARQNPYIIHYAGYQKPWNYAETDMGGIFWEYAKLTPYYERLLLMLAKASVKPADIKDDRSTLRKIADFFLPYGTRRRSVVKFVFKPLIYLRRKIKNRNK